MSLDQKYQFSLFLDSTIILEFRHILFTLYSYEEIKFTYDKFESVKFGFSISYLFSEVSRQLLTILIITIDKEIYDIYQ